MGAKKTFVTIFPICENVHLTTDIGQIPFFMHKNHGYESTIVAYKNSESYPNLEEEVKGLQMNFLENKGRFIFLERAVLQYIKKNAKHIDVLDLYHFSKFTFVYGLLYKKLNSKGILLIKLDAYNETFAEGNVIKHSTNKLKNAFFKYLERKFLKQVDLLCIENSEGERLLKKMYPAVSSKALFLPVGVNDLFLVEVFKDKVKEYDKKENIILSLGRIGEPIKNHEMILRALTKIDMKDWRMVFVGQINESFANYFNELSKEYPVLKEKVTFIGRIANRIELYEWYNKSKVFCMTSWHESFCHAIGEAFYFGNYIIGTEGIMSMKDITDSGKYGITLKADDDTALANTFQSIINNQTNIKELYQKRVEHSHTYFIWSEIINKLNNQINKIEKAHA